MTAYQFRGGITIPEGVTPDGIMAERSQIEQDYGRVTTELSVEAVLAQPERFPNLRAFGPADEADAMRRALAEGIRNAYRSVVIVRPETRKPLRAIHRLDRKNDDGTFESVFKEFEVIRRTPEDRKALIKQLRQEAEAFQGKLVNVLTELEDLA